MGQGHCFFFKSNKHNVAVLIDAGSRKAPVASIPNYQPTESRGRADTINRLRKQEIIDKIKACGINGQTKFLCIVTHGDEDHYGWIANIIDKLPKKPDLCILGGSRNNYPTGFSTGAAEDLFVADQYQRFAGDHIADLNTNRISAFADMNLAIQILHASNDSMARNEDEKNDHSIVTQIKLGNFSFLITGDAGSSVTDAIRAHFHQNQVQSTVLLASHHGATTHGSNNQAWFQHVNPQYVIFSHGDVKEFFHPHPAAILNALQLPRIHQNNATNNHVLFYGFREGEQNVINVDPTSVTKKFARTFAKINVGYRLMLTNTNILSTFTQGDIVFKIPNAQTHSVGWSKTVNELRPFYELYDSLQLPLTGYLNETHLGNELTDLYLSRCRNFFEEFVFFDAVVNPQNFSSKLRSLRHIDCSNIIPESPDLKRLYQLILADSRTHQQLRSLDIQGNSLSQDGVRRFQDAWGYRGLHVIPQ